MRGMGNMQGMMKKMQKMQKEMMEAQEALNAQQFEGSAGGGMVKVVMNGQRQMLEVNLDESVVDPEDIKHTRQEIQSTDIFDRLLFFVFKLIHRIN